MSAIQADRQRSGLALQCIWICALSFQVSRGASSVASRCADHGGRFQKYGFNISALNSLSSAISCAGIQSATSWLPSCFPMGATRFGYLTSIYTIGGLVGSLCTGTIADRRGRRSACLAGAFSIVLGGALMALAPSFVVLLVGRYARLDCT